jgi:hypothetical protein
MWKMRTKIVPVTIGTVGTVENGLDRNLQLLSGHPSAIRLEVTLVSTAHIILEVLG